MSAAMDAIREALTRRADNRTVDIGIGDDMVVVRGGDLREALDAGDFWRQEYDHKADEWAESCALEAKRADVAEHRLRNLLALIHRDGGHYEGEHGLEKACDDAEDLVVARLGVVDEHAALVTAVRAYVADVDALERGPATVGDVMGLRASKAVCRATIDEMLARRT